MSAPVLSPNVLWAQRTNEIYLTISVSDVESPLIELTSDKLSFKGDSKGQHFAVDLEFYGPVDVEVSEWLIINY